MLDLETIKARIAAATPEPWDEHPLLRLVLKRGIPVPQAHIAETVTPEDAEFIGLARRELPRLVAEVERLRAALNEAAYALFELKRTPPERVREKAAAAHERAAAALDG